MQTATQGVQWIAALLVVRLLTPADYGLVAMSAAYLGLVKMVSEFGLGAAIIQRRDLTESQIARLGGVSVLTGASFVAISLLLSGVVADFFDEPRVAVIVIVLSTTFLFSGVDVVARSLLRRDLKFQRLAWVQAASNLTYSAISLGLAVLGFGYWSLVLGALSAAIVRMASALAACPHPVAWPSDLRSIRSELWFGWHVVVSQFALYVRSFADILIVGRLLGGEALGAYNVGWTQANMVPDRATPIVSDVSASVLAATQNDTPALRRYVRVFTEGIAFFAFPASFGMAVVADDFVMLVFGERWVATIGPLRVLACVAAMRSITPILSQTLIAVDQAKKNMQFAVISGVIVPLCLLVGSKWGITGVALGWLVGQPLATGPILLRHALRAADMRLRDYLAALGPATLASLATVLAVLAVRVAMPGTWPLAPRFAFQVVVGIGVYALWMFTTYRQRFQSFLNVLRAARRAAPQAAPAEDVQ